MDPAEMNNIRSLLPSFRSTIASLTTSPALQIIKSYPPRPTSPPSTSTSQKQRTVCILDSSFNPPTKAHMHLALQALRKYTISEVEDKEEEPPSLLLLLATTNADKPSSPASYEHRLAMMCLLAEEIQTKTSSSSSSSSIDNIVAPRIDIGITPHPRFIDKSTDLSNHPFFPSEVTRQVWILGYDTLTRLLNPKYYPPHHTLTDLHTTLLSSTNRILVFTRPGTDFGNESSQYEYSNSLDPSISKKIDMVVPDDAEQVDGVSSTNVRNGVRDGSEDWELGVCSGVARWIGREGLYL
ncbi:hypothetical protein TWF192_006859 [Orbilia oligospora]|uniref:Uncharacterized protein n=1 Tax=Orbilia oligospora TaxID=2813651 RepID=A0A6G1M6X7_ORBOL|nr:hypothetical protein TWF191_008952 [Orbilia oligospora]KAF3246347.1 hypothetical protein TWF192_006859 [Orbilia oligospora]